MRANSPVSLPSRRNFARASWNRLRAVASPLVGTSGTSVLRVWWEGHPARHAATTAARATAAPTVARACHRLDPKNPEVVALAAAVSDASGDIDDALVQYPLLHE